MTILSQYDRRMDSSFDPTATELLTKAFLLSDKALAEKLAAEMVPSSVEVERFLVVEETEEENGGSWSGEFTTERVNFLQVELDRSRFRIRPPQETLPRPWLSEAAISVIDSAAVAILNAADNTLPFPVLSVDPISDLIDEQRTKWVGFPSFERDPKDWVKRAVVLPALVYHLSKQSTFGEADEAQAVAFARDLGKVCTSKRLRLVVSSELVGLDIEGEVLRDSNVALRRLDPLERGTLAQQADVRRSMFSAHVPRVALELEISASSGFPFSFHVDAMLPLLCTLELHGHTFYSESIKVRSDPPWALKGLPDSSFTMPYRPPKKIAVVDASHLAALKETFDLVARRNLVEPRSAADQAIRRFGTGAFRLDNADALLDFTIALETLFLPPDENARRGDLGYRFRVHGAYYLADTTDQRRDLADRLTKIYDMRSRLVHGNKYPSRDEIGQRRNDAHNFVRRGIQRALREGFPTAETFKDLLLGPRS